MELKLPVPVPRITDTVPAPLLAIAKSALLSPLKSSLIMEYGLLPLGKFVAVPNVPDPEPINMEVLIEQLRLTIAISGFVSPLKSALAIDVGALVVPIVILVGAPKLPVL